MPQGDIIECPYCQTSQMYLHQTSRRFADSVYWQCPHCQRISDMIDRDADPIAEGKIWAKRVRYAICQNG